MAEQLQRLNDVFPKFTPGSDAFKRLAYSYADALHDFDLEALQGGVSIAIRLADRFPTPAKLREYCGDWIRANRGDPLKARNDTSAAAGCPTCGAVARWAWHRRDDGTEYSRLVIVCDPTRHPPGTSYNPTPANFIEWDESPPPAPGAWRSLLQSLAAQFDARRS